MKPKYVALLWQESLLGVTVWIWKVWKQAPFQTIDEAKNTPPVAKGASGSPVKSSQELGVALERLQAIKRIGGTK